MNTLMLCILLVLPALLTLAAERVPRLPKECFFVLGGLVLGAVWSLTGSEPEIDAAWSSALLCVLLFAQSYRARMCDITRHGRAVGVLSVLSAVLFAALSGGLLFVLTDHSVWTCLAVGAVLSAVIPAPVLYGMRRAGIPEEIAELIEGVALFGSGTAVVLAAVCSALRDGGVTGAVRAAGGGLLIGVVLTVVMVLLFRLAKEERTGILISICALVLAVALCGMAQASAPVAAFLLSIGFAVRVDRREQRHPQDYIFYRHIWQELGDYLSGVSYVFAGAVGISAAMQLPADLLIRGLLVIVLMPVVRFVSVLIGTLFGGRLPQRYHRLPFALVLAWSGTAGDLSVPALIAMVGTHAMMSWIAAGSVVLGVLFSSLTAGAMTDRVEQRRRFDAPKPRYHD